MIDIFFIKEISIFYKIISCFNNYIKNYGYNNI